MTIEPPDDSLVAEAAAAIRSSNVRELKRLLTENPGLAIARLGGAVNSCGGGQRTLLHVLTDWPGNLREGPAMVTVLVEAGADVNARFIGPHTETPLHWAASCDDVAVLDALLDHGADIEATGAVIAGGTPLADAVTFGQWKAARRLVERGAVANLWQGAALGLMDVVCRPFESNIPPAAEEITNAFWCAGHGGQREAAEFLLGHGAELNWIGHDQLTPLDAAQRSGAAELVKWLRSRGGKSANELS